MADEQGQGQGQGLKRGYDVRPVPDPTELTTQALYREVGALKELLFVRIDAMEQAIRLFNDNLTRVPTALDKEVVRLKELYEGRFECVEREIVLVREVIQTRFDASEKAVKLLQDQTDKMPNRIDEKISALKDIHEGQFEAIQEQFIERDKRSEQSSRQSEVAISAALQAQKEAAAEQNRSFSTAANKSEISTDKRIDQIYALVNSITMASDSKISDIKDRLTRIEGQALGKMETKSEASTSSGLIVSVIAVIIGFIGIAVAVATALMRTR
jgi:hypothetical protein